MAVEAPVLCTVAIPAYNYRTFIERAVRSALAQDVPGLRVLVVDDASTDGTWDVLQSLKADNLHVVRNTRNLGLFGNFNRCLALAEGTYLRLLLSDDILPAGALGREIALMERHADVAMLNSSGLFVDARGRPLRRFADDFPPGIYEGKAFARHWLAYYVHYRRNAFNYPSGVLLRRTSVGADLRFDESLKTAGDVDFFLRLLGRGNLAIVDAIGCHVTRHSSQAHVGPNLDGTAMREHYSLLVKFLALKGLREQFAGMCLAVAAFRALRPRTWHSARAHLEVARSTGASMASMLLRALLLLTLRATKVVLGRRAPFVPRPLRPL
jgi:glycosyltransferase involved in cell wall biosynthesis